MSSRTATAGATASSRRPVQRARARATAISTRVRNASASAAEAAPCRGRGGVGAAGADRRAGRSASAIGRRDLPSWAAIALEVEDIAVRGRAAAERRRGGAAPAASRGATPIADVDPERLAATAGGARLGRRRRARCALPGGTVVVGVREREPLAVVAGVGGPLGVDADGRRLRGARPAGGGPGWPRLRCESDAGARARPTPAPGRAIARRRAPARARARDADRGRPRRRARPGRGWRCGCRASTPASCWAPRTSTRASPRLAAAARGGRTRAWPSAAQVDLRFAGQGASCEREGRLEGVGVKRRRGADAPRSIRTGGRAAGSGGPVSGGRRGTWPRRTT